MIELSTKVDAYNGIWAYYSYCDEKGFWEQFASLDERMASVQVSEDILRDCSSLELVALCVANPLANIYTAYNNELVGIDVVADRINVFSELEKRIDAASALIEFYSNVTINPKSTESLQLIDGKYGLSLVSCNFLELYLASARVPSLYSDENRSDLLSSLERLYKTKKANPGVFSWYSYSKELLLKDVLALGENASPEQVKRIYQQRWSYIDALETKTPGNGNSVSGIMTMFPVTTRGGKQVDAFLMYEMNEIELQGIYTTNTSTHPNAIVLGPSTATYNCHSYAWYISDNLLSHTPCWITRDLQNELEENNLSKYWTNDFYSEVSSEAAVEKIYYRGADHSAIIDFDGNYYISKWGPGPLMKHLPSDCPYDMIDMHYYAHVDGDNNGGSDGTSGDGSGGTEGGSDTDVGDTDSDSDGDTEPIDSTILRIVGPVSISVGQSYSYTASQMFDTNLLEWSCSSGSLQITPSTGRTVSVYAENPGRHVLSVTYNMYGEEMDRARLIIFAE